MPSPWGLACLHAITWKSRTTRTGKRWPICSKRMEAGSHLRCTFSRRRRRLLATGGPRLHSLSRLFRAHYRWEFNHKKYRLDRLDKRTEHTMYDIILKNIERYLVPRSPKKMFNTSMVGFGLASTPVMVVFLHLRLRGLGLSFSYHHISTSCSSASEP